MDVREAAHTRMSHELKTLKKGDGNSIEAEDDSTSGTTAELGVETSQLFKRYDISTNTRDKIFIPNLEDGGSHSTPDPAYKVSLYTIGVMPINVLYLRKDFGARLKRHVLARFTQKAIPGDEPHYSPQELDQVIIEHNVLYSHSTASFNFTTYDLRRDRDTITLKTGKVDVIVPSFEDAALHPYWYARVLGIYHVRIFFPGQLLPKQIHLLHVRWFGSDPEWESGPKHLRLDRVGFVPSNDPDAFGFIDPSLVIRGAHLLPAFHFQRTVALLAPSTAREDAGDWVNFYVNRCVFYHVCIGF